MMTPEETSALPTIRVLFRHKLLTADFDDRVMVFHSGERNEDVKMMRVMRMNYQQEYIPHEYIELRFPASTDVSGNGHRLNPNHLHILPWHSFIALPNKDKKIKIKK